MEHFDDSGTNFQKFTTDFVLGQMLKSNVGFSSATSKNKKRE
jgi:hypothetical protein